ncbi:GNAT family N-acetyltransferase [Rubrivirga sp.]|uniref:GNAT family N-acetyltransferase n=1 Tax=Rubrivirga sp. TaxID=1885344 RepID=UPI003C746A6F
MPDLEGVVTTTNRLRLRVQTIEDAPFLLSLMTDPDWIRHIGDRRVRTVEDVERYVLEGAIAQQAEHGCSLYLVERLSDGAPVGICGLVTRDGLEAPDLGYALTPQHRGRGYAREATRAALEVARDLGETRVLAVVTLDNGPSRTLLEDVGFREARIAQQDDGPVLVMGIDLEDVEVPSGGEGGSGGLR